MICYKCGNRVNTEDLIVAISIIPQKIQSGKIYNSFQQFYTRFWSYKAYGDQKLGKYHEECDKAKWANQVWNCKNGQVVQAKKQETLMGTCQGKEFELTA